MASSRTAPRRFREPLPLSEEPTLPTVVTAARASRRAEECPVCAGSKVRGFMFCVRCRGALPRGAFLVLGALEREEDRARWWQQACADLRGE